MTVNAVALLTGSGHGVDTARRSNGLGSLRGKRRYHRDLHPLLGAVDGTAQSGDTTTDH